MPEVPSVLFGFMCDALDDGGCNTRAARRGLELAELSPRLGLRVRWDEVATVLNRAAEGLSDEEMERIGEGYLRVNRYLSALLGIVTRPRVLYRMAWIASRQAFPHMTFTVEDLAEHTLQLSMTLPRSFVGSYFFFRATAGELRAGPRLLDLPDAEVETEAGTHHGRYRLQLAEPERLWTRLLRGRDEARELLAEDLFASLSAVRPTTVGGSTRLLQEQHGLTRAEARVATRLAAGKTVADIAAELGVSVETVRTHLKRAYHKTGVRRQAELVRLVLGERDEA